MALKWLFFCRNKRWTDTVTGEVYEPQSLILFDDAGPQWPIAERALSATMDGGRVAVVAGSGVDFDPANAGPLAGVTAITGTAVQSSATDATGSRLMRNGAHGLGGDAIVTENFDAITASGFYRNGTAGAVGAPTANSLWSVYHHNISAALAVQIAVRVGRMFIRNKSTTWAPWLEIYNRSNIIGTVSQSGGVPTGAGFEAGANASGVYVRFADGSQICWHSESAAGEQVTSQGIGNLFRSPESRSFTFPASFSAPPKVTPDAIRTAGVVWPAQGSGSISNNSFSGVFLMSATSNGAGRLGYIAVGRWFNL